MQPSELLERACRLYDTLLEENARTERLLLMLTSATLSFQRSLVAYQEATQSFYGYGVLVNVYGDQRRLRVVRWTAGFLFLQGNEDRYIREVLCREGIPEDAVIVDTTIEKNVVQNNSGALKNVNFCLVLEHPGYMPLVRDQAIPEQIVRYIDVRGAMSSFSLLPKGEEEEKGA